MTISIIAAVADNGVIGKNGELPWHLPADLKYFRRTTKGYPIIMGRRTFESILEALGKPFPERTNIVLSKEKPPYEGDYHVAGSVEQALAIAEDTGAEEVFIGGGASVYEQFLPEADKLYITEVHADVDGDVQFPEVNRQQWRQLSREDHQPDDRNPHPYSFIVYERAESESA